MLLEVRLHPEASPTSARTSSGVVFGTLNVPIRFDIGERRPAMDPLSLRFVFLCKRDPDKKSFAVERGSRLVDGHAVSELTFYNPSAAAPSGLLAPTPIFVWNVGPPEEHVVLDFMSAAPVV